MDCEDISIDEIMNVCRLCLCKTDLISVFDDKENIPDNILNKIRVTTGIIITPTDNVTQKLCNKCLRITVKMFEFRTSSILHDMQLKANAEQISRPVLHETVQTLKKKYPRIVLPLSVTKTNISPVVIIDKIATINLEERTQEAKQNKKSGTPAQVVTDSPSQGYEFEDIENQIKPYLIPNNEKLVRSDTPNQNEKVSSTASSDISNCALEIVEPEKQCENAEISESIMATKKQNEKAKRRLSEAQNSAIMKKFKSNANFDSDDNSVESLLTLKYVTRSLFICEICNGILYTAKDLKKHKTSHMKCHLCKKTFRSLEETKQHKDSECVIKRIMNNLPTIILKPCDKSEEVRKRYPSVFNDSNETRRKEDISCSLPVQSQIDCQQGSTVNFEENEKAEIQHDPVFLNVKSEECATEFPLISYDENDQSTIDIKFNNISCAEIKNAEVAHLENNTRSTIDTLRRSEKSPQKPRILSNAYVKPEIHIIGENAFEVNLNDAEDNVLKSVLKKAKKKMKDTCSQTNIPCNANIETRLNKNKLFYLKDLKNYLSFNKVLVNLSFSPKHSMKFNSEQYQLKKGGHWSTHVTKRPVSSEPLTVNFSPENTIQDNNVGHQIINNNISTSLSTSCSIENQIPTNNLVLDVPSDLGPQSNERNLQIQPNSGGTFLVVPTITGHSILGTLAFINPNFRPNTDLNNVKQNSVSQRDNSIMSHSLTNSHLHQKNGLQNNSTSNNILWKSATGQHTSTIDIQTAPQFIKTSYNGYSQPNTNIHITNEIARKSTNNLFVGPKPKTLLLISPATTNAEILSSMSSQNTLAPPTYVSTSYSKNDDNSTMRIKNVSDHR